MILRTLLFTVTVLAATMFYGFKLIVAAYLRVPHRVGGLYDRATRGWSKAILWAAGTKVRIRNAERVPTPPVVYVSNHTSMFDVLALAATLPDTVRFVAKKELLKLPIFGKALQAAGHIAIDRQNRQAAFEAYDEAAQVIRAGTSAVVFPEGTRSRTGALQAFKKGPFVLAITAQVPIVPLYVSNTYEIKPKGRFTIRPKPIVIQYSDPIATTGLVYADRVDLSARTRAAMLGAKALVDADFLRD